MPLSTLTFELNGGHLWPQIADWERVIDAVVDIARHQDRDAMAMGLPQLTALLVAHGSNTIHHPDGSRSQAGPADRQQHLDDLAEQVRQVAAEGPFWPGANLVAPPREPQVLPYMPYHSS